MIGAAPITILAGAAVTPGLPTITFQTPNGTSPVLDSGGAILTLTSTDSSVTITGNSATDTINFAAAAPTITNVSSNISLANKTIYLVDTSSARTLTFPSPASGTSFTVKDVTGNANTNNVTFARFASEKIEGIAASYIAYGNFFSLTFLSNGTDWFIT